MNNENQTDLKEFLLNNNKPDEYFHISNEDLQLILDENNINSGFSTQILDKKGGVKALFDDLNIDPLVGICEGDEERRKKEFGENTPFLPKVNPLWKNIIKTYQNKLVFFLILASVLKLIIDVYSEKRKVNEIVLMYIIIVIISVLNAVSILVKDKIFLDLHKELNSKYIRVLRNGKEKMIHQNQLLVGDILILTAGDTLNNDGIIIKAFSVELITNKEELKCFLFIDTYNSIFLFKNKQSNTTKYQFILSGSKIIKGFVYVLILSVGENVMNKSLSTYTSKIYSTSKNDNPQQSFGFLYDFIIEIKPKIMKCGLYTSIILYFLLIFRFLISDNHHLSFWFIFIDDLINVIILVIISIPEGLLLILLLTLANSIRALKNKGILLKNIESLEEMATCNIICTDYRGILTKNKSLIQTILLNDKVFSFEEIKKLKGVLHEDYYSFLVEGLSVLTIAFKSEINNVNFYYGVPYECALIKLLSTLNENYVNYRNNYNRPIIDRSSNSQESQFIYTIIEMSEKSEKVRIYILGEYFFILNYLSSYLQYSSNKNDLLLFEFTDQFRERVNSYIKPKLKAGSNGYVLCYKDLNRDEYYTILSNKEKYHVEIKSILLSNLTFIGLIELNDELRKETKSFISSCRKMGIDLKMFCNSSENNGIIYGKNCDLLQSRKGNQSVQIRSGSGNESISNNSDIDSWLLFNCKSGFDDFLNQNLYEKEEFSCDFLKAKVFYNSSIEDKYIITDVLSQLGNNVSVISDSILKTTERITSISLGRYSSDMVKESCDIINNDDLNNIIQTIIYARHFYDTIIKYFLFYMSFIFSLLILLVLINLPFFPFVFNPHKLLWLNLLINVLYVIVFSIMSPSEKDQMSKKAYSKVKTLLSFKNILFISVQVTIQVILILIIYLFKDFFLIIIIKIEAYSNLLTDEKEFMKNLFVTFVFNVFVMLQIVNSFLCRTRGNHMFFHNLLIDYKFLIGEMLILYFHILAINNKSLLITRSLSIYSHLFCFGISTLLIISYPIYLFCVKLLIDNTPEVEEVRLGGQDENKSLLTNCEEQRKERIEKLERLKEVIKKNFNLKKKSIGSVNEFKHSINFNRNNDFGLNKKRSMILPTISIEDFQVNKYSK